MAREVRPLMRPVAQLDRQTARGIRHVLMDIDDTITTGGKLTARAYGALWRLHDAGLHVIPITGRPAGWCDLIARQWPVDGVVGENGALAFWEEGGRVRRLFHEQAQENDHPVLRTIEKRVLNEIPGSRVAGDQTARMFDLALDFAEDLPRLTLEDARKIKDICEQEGAHAKISSIHVNAWVGRYDKLEMTTRLLTHSFGEQGADVSAVMFFGDSPNDEPMFTRFPCSVEVANISRYAHLMHVLPSFVTCAEGGEGFAEGVEVLLRLRA